MRLVKQGKTKKHIAILLVLAMLLTIMPMSVFAEGDGGSEPTTPEVATPITLIGGESKTIDKAGLFDVTAQFTTAGTVQWAVGDVAQGKAVETAEITLEDETVVYTATLVGVTLAAEQKITATLTATDTTVVDGLVATGTVAKEVEIAETTVAMIDDIQYNGLDVAIAAATDGDTIELLKDCELSILDVNKDLTIKGNAGSEKITFKEKGINIKDKALTFEECIVEMIGVGATSSNDWMAICASPNGSLTLNKVKMTMDGTGTIDGGKDSAYTHGIYFCGNNMLNLKDSELTIKNYSQDALEWDGGTEEYNFLCNNSTFVATGNRSGLAGTFTAKIVNDSKFYVNENKGNGSNGSNFIVEDSKVQFNSNGSHGLSAGKLIITDSTVEAIGNGANGIHVKSDLQIKRSEVAIKENDCSISSTWTIPGALYINGNSEIETSKVVIEDNNGSGIYQNAGTLNIKKDAVVSIMRNTAEKLGYGGGIYVNGTVDLADNVVLYNNHAGTAGDDIYNLGTITFGATGDDWALDGTPNHCADGIDGWYDDSKSNRWEAHKEPYHIQKLQPRDFEGVTITEPLALKAAHGLIVPDEPFAPKDPLEVDISKSKTATNLDKNLESQVTLALPSISEQVSSDILFVMDYSTCGKKASAKAIEMLEELSKQVADKNANVKIGAVVYRGETTTFPFEQLNADSVERLSTFMATQPIVKGSNMHMGLLKAQEMLAADKTVEDKYKYMILVSDGIAYIWDENGENYGLNAEQIDGPSKIFLASPDGWQIKYGNSNPPENWAEHFESLPGKVNNAIQLYAAKYDRNAPIEKYIPYSQRDDYASTVDVALYKSYQVYNTLESQYNCYAVLASEDIDAVSYPWGPAFMNYLSNGKNVSFDDIRNDIYYLLGAGSTVEDYMGYVEGEDGYNFDFINKADAMVMKVGDIELKAEVIGENQYGFGKQTTGEYDYVVTYHPGEKATEYFTWTLNKPVCNFEPIQLTYTVKLINPQKDAGTYGKYDVDGSQGYTELYTNDKAILHPVDSNNQPGEDKEFGKPTVSYKVDEDGPGPGPGPNPDPDPDKPTVDIPDPDVPLTEPDVPEEPIIDIDEPEVPLTDVPGEEVEIDQPEVPLGDAPKTGDAAPVVGLVGLMVAAVIGLAITRRKLN